MKYHPFRLYSETGDGCVFDFNRFLHACVLEEENFFTSKKVFRITWRDMDGDEDWYEMDIVPGESAKFLKLIELELLQKREIEKTNE